MALREFSSVAEIEAFFSDQGAIIDDDSLFNLMRSVANACEVEGKGGSGEIEYAITLIKVLRQEVATLRAK